VVGLEKSFPVGKNEKGGENKQGHGAETVVRNQQVMGLIVWGVRSRRKDSEAETGV